MPNNFTLQLDILLTKHYVILGESPTGTSSGKFRCVEQTLLAEILARNGRGSCQKAVRYAHELGGEIGHFQRWLSFTIVFIFIQKERSTFPGYK